MEWYKDIDNAIFPTEDDKEKNIYRIIPFDTLLQMLTEHKNYLVKTSKWEDSYENFFLKETFMHKGKPQSLDYYKERVFGQCWTTRQSSDALWRIYSPDKKSVRIKTTVGKLWHSTNESVNKGKCVIGQVQYLSQSQIQKDLQNSRPLSLKKVADLMVSSFFVKRQSFSHESEYRVIYLCDQDSKDKEKDVKECDIDPLSFIMNIYFDPRSDETYVNRCKKILSDALGFPSNRIHKSTLYDFKPITIQIV